MGKAVRQVDQSFFEDAPQPTVVDESFFAEEPAVKKKDETIGAPLPTGTQPLSPSKSQSPFVNKPITKNEGESYIDVDGNKIIIKNGIEITVGRPTKEELNTLPKETMEQYEASLSSISEEEKKKQIDYIIQKNSGGGFAPIGTPISISDHVFNQKVSPKEQYQIQQKQEAVDIANALKNPSVENVRKLAEKGIQKKVEEVSTATVLERAKLLNPGEERIELPEFDENKVRTELTNDFNKKFLSGELNSDDIDVLKSGNPLLNSGNIVSVPNEQLASQINLKTKNLKDYANAKNVDGNTFYFENKDVQNNINKLKFQINNIESTSEEKIFVDADETKLPNEAAGVVYGQVYVNRQDHVNELKKRLTDEENKEFFLRNDFKVNRYDPVASKHIKILIDNITKSGNIDLNAFGTGISQDEDMFIKRTVDDYLKKENNPVINAAQGVTEQPVDQREYLDIYNQVRDYFHNVIPVKGWVDNQMKHFMNAESNQKFKPLVDNIENIHSFFDSDETQKFESVLNATTDANQAAIYDKYNKLLSTNPKFNEIVEGISKQIQAGEISEDQANIDVAKQLRNVAELKPILDKQDNEIKAVILDATKQREKRLINGIQGLPQNIVLNPDGSIGLKGVSPEETKKFIDNYYNYQNDVTKDAVKIVAEDRQIDADQVLEGYRRKYGGFLTATGTGLAQGYGNMMESATRWLSNSMGVGSDMRDYYTTGNKAIGDITENSEFANKHFKYNGLRSLIDPRYYAYNVAQSASYMAPGMAATIATGGGASGAIIGGVISSGIETAQNGLQTYNELLTSGKDEFGLPITEYQAGRAMANQMGSEIIPNLLLQSLEFGTIFRGAKIVKPRLNIAGGIKDLVKTGFAEGAQEAIQGYVQYNAKQQPLGKEDVDIWDYMQTDDFRQNFFGGLAGGIGFGAGGKATQLVNRSKNLKEWEQMVKGANDDFKQSSFYGYATQSEMDGQGPQFRDALRLRLQNEQYKDNEEKNGLMQMLSYSAKLSDATKSLGVVPGNINGLAAAHNLALADMYEDYSNTGNKDSSLSKIYKQKAADYKSQAQDIINGNDKGIHYALTANGTPIFMSQQNAKVLQEDGTLDNLYAKGLISAVSDNIKVDTDEAPIRIQKLETRRQEIQQELAAITRTVNDEQGQEIGKTIPKENQKDYIDLSKELKNVENSLEGLKPEPIPEEEQPNTLSPEETIVEAAHKGNLEGVYGDMVKADPSKASDVILDLAKQKYGIQEDGTEHPDGGRDISMKTSLDVDDAVTKVFPDKESVIKAIIQPKKDADNIYYHGTSNSFSDFSATDKEKSITGNPTSVWGTFFTKNKEEANRYIRDFHGGEGKIVSANIELNNPYIMSISEFNSFTTPNDLSNPKWKEMEEKSLEFKDKLISQGYDGIVIGEGKKFEETVVFNKSKIKILPSNSIGEEQKAIVSAEQVEKGVAEKGKELADKLRKLKTKRDIAAAHIFGIPIALYDGAIETIATAIEKGAELAQAIQEGIKHIKDNGGREVDVTGFKKHIEDYVAGEKPKIKVQVGEEEKPKVKVKLPKEDKEEEGDIIDDYEMKTSGEVNNMLSGKTLEDVFGDRPEGEQNYEVQRLNEMLADGRNMIQMAQAKWGLDVMEYGRPLLEYAQSMSDDKQLTNKKAVLLATFLGELKETIIRDPARKGEIQPLYNQVEQYYQRYMNKVAKEFAAGRLLRLYRDKYLGDVFADRILEESQIKEKRKLQDAELKKKIDDETAAEETRITQEEKDEQDKADKQRSKKAKDNQSKKKKLSSEDAKKKADAKMEEIKNKAGDKKGLIDKINDAIKRLNCK